MTSFVPAKPTNNSREIKIRVWITKSDIFFFLSFVLSGFTYSCGAGCRGLPPETLHSSTIPDGSSRLHADSAPSTAIWSHNHPARTPYPPLGGEPIK